MQGVVAPYGAPGSPPNVAPEPAPTQAVLLPHKGHVTLERSAFGARDWFLVHSISAEQVRLPTPKDQQGYEMGFDREGFGVVFDGPSDGVGVGVDHYLKLGVYAVGDSKMIVHPSGRSEYLEEARRSWRPCELSLVIDLSPQPAHLAAARFSLPRSGCVIYWSFESLYRQLGLSQKHSVPSKWVFKSITSWENVAAKMGSSAAISRSRQYMGAAGPLDADRTLPWVAASTTLLLGLLARWSHLTKFNGGFEDEDNRQRASNMFRGLLGAMFSNGTWFLRFFVDEGAVWDEPHLPSGRRPVVVQVGSLGAELDLLIVVEALNSGSASMRKLAEGLRDRLPMDLGGFALWCAEVSHPGNFLWRQVFQCMSEQLELCLKADRDFSVRFLQSSEPSVVDRDVAAYVQAGVRASRSHLHYSLVVDKSRVAGKGVLNSAVVLPTNTAWWLIPQDCADFRGEATLKRQLGDEDGAQSAAQQQVKRQAAWLAHAEEGHRPPKRHRVASHEWMLCIEQQMKESMCNRNWKFFAQPPDLSQRHPDAAQWPSLTIAGDMDAPQLCPISYLVRQLSVNVEFVNDPSHGAWRDVGRALGDTNLTAFMKLMMVAENIPHGPWCEDMRWKQCQQAVREHFSFFDQDTSELFRALAPLMVKDLTTEGRDILGQGSLEQRMWAELQVNWSRFMGAISACRRSLRLWHQKLFGYLLTCIELDMLRGKHVTAWHVSSAPAGAAGASLKRSSVFEDKTLQNACANQMVVGTLMLSDSDNLVRARLVVTLSGPTERWHQHQASFLRNVHHSEKWQRSQRQGAFFEHLAETLGLLQNETALRSIGFAMEVGIGATPLQGQEDCRLLQEAEVATLAGDFATCLVWHRVKRHMALLRGWPRGLVCMTNMSSREEQQEEINLLRRDWENYQELSTNHSHSGQSALKRSLFATVPAQQCVQVCMANEWSACDSVAEFASAKARVFAGSQVVEDAFKRQSRQVDFHANGQGRMPKLFHVMLQREVLRKVHEYDEVEANDDLLLRSVKVPASAYQAHAGIESLNLHGIIGNYSTTSWYSPGAENWAVQYADLALVSGAIAQGEVASLRQSWLGFVVQARHRILIRRVGDGSSPPGPWQFGLGHFSDSCCLVWPAIEKAEGGASWYEFDLGERKPSFMSLMSFHGWEAMEFSWQGPLQQSLGVGSRGYGLRAVCVTEAMPLLDLCCRCAWWSTSRMTLLRVADFLGVEVDKTADLYGVLFRLISDCLGVGANDATEIMERRAQNERKALPMCLGELLKMDVELADWMDKDEQKAFAKEKKDAKVQKEKTEDFSKKVYAERNRQRAAAQGGRGSRSNPSGTMAKKSLGERKYRPVPKGDLTQPQVKSFLPPGASCWEGRSNGSWQGHLSKEFPRVSKSWFLYGNRGAALLMLRELWEQWCLKHGVERDTVPIPNLFHEDVLEPGQGSSSSSSAPAVTMGAARK